MALLGALVLPLAVVVGADDDDAVALAGHRIREILRRQVDVGGLGLVLGVRAVGERLAVDLVAEAGERVVDPVGRLVSPSALLGRGPIFSSSVRYA